MNPVRIIRKELGLTQNEMAQRLGMSLRSYQDVEAHPSPRRVYILAAEHLKLLQRYAP